MANIEDLQDNKYVKGEVLLFDKPLHWTSFDLVNKVRKILCDHLQIKKLKVGHAGTLDPLATGLMIICTGKMTKQIDSFQAQEKEYIATIGLGATTISYDLEHEKENFKDTSYLTKEMVEETINSFLGKQIQYPPVFSAKKVDGKPLYKRVHKGHDAEQESKKVRPQEIEIFELELLEYSNTSLKVRVKCSKGTYIRSLANDLGQKLGCGAFLEGLIRTQSGEHLLKNATTWEKFQADLLTQN